jgi:glycosyltransferase involved in cell wall biosynthesis
MTPDISVIMPCLNSAEHVRASVASALAQTFSDIELLVVDNGSVDDTISVVRSVDDSRIRLLREPRRGVSAARNLGIAAARGRFIAFLDSDDSWAPECLANLYSALCSENDAVLAYCGWQNIGLSGPRGEPFIPPDYETPDKRVVLFAGCRWPIHAALVQRNAVVAAGGFDTSLTNCEDYALWLEIAGSRRIVRVPEVLAFYHFDREDQASRDRARTALHQLRAQAKYLKAHPEFEAALGERRRQLTVGILRDRGFECYWRRDLRGARILFRKVLQLGYASPQDWKYLLPALLPYRIHRFLVQSFEKDSA